MTRNAFPELISKSNNSLKKSCYFGLANVFDSPKMVMIQRFFLLVPKGWEWLPVLIAN